MASYKISRNNYINYIKANKELTEAQKTDYINYVNNLSEAQFEKLGQRSNYLGSGKLNDINKYINKQLGNTYSTKKNNNTTTDNNSTNTVSISALDKAKIINNIQNNKQLTTTQKENFINELNRQLESGTLSQDFIDSLEVYAIYPSTLDNTSDVLDRDVSSNDYLNSLISDAYKDQTNMILDPDSSVAQRYLSDMTNSINAEEAEYNKTLNDLELSAYRQIGYAQQELENTIAENRLKAIKSGTTSAQLAAQQLNSMFAAQSGAATIAQQAYSDRLSAAQEYSQMRNTGLTTSLYDTINNNKTTLNTTGAQNLAATSSYASYINSQLANLQANTAAYNTYGKTDYNRIMGLS